ncbi:MAG TPA: DUF1501 domain-containing protein [Bryobacteraceae bacterium]|nr:DUF1501 domain-containing protein [Bryobacteraceae bacterium]
MQDLWMPMRARFSRRDLFDRLGMGLGAIAVRSLFAEEAGGIRTRYDVAERQPQFKPRAKRVIMLFQNGGPSHIDLFDPKPQLVQRHGQKPGDGYVNPVDVKKTGVWMGSSFKFSRYGQSGMEISELLPETARHADKIAVIRSMVTAHSNHEQAIWNFNTGVVQAGRPALGSWVAYGLGTTNQDLPAYVAILHPKGLPVDGIRNFSSGWLPEVFHGVPMRAEGTPVVNLQPQGSSDAARSRFELLQQINREHLKAHPGQIEMESRIASFELAARMQLAASSVLDISREPRAIHELYGTEDPETGIHARQCLLARRLVESGVRFVQVLHQGQPWDTHKDNDKGQRQIAHRTDRPTAALLTDLEQRGLLSDTLVIWAGEFGRTPMSEGADGRDHHKDAFSIWIAGGGVKGGLTYGATDDFGYKVVEHPVTIADYHATLLHQLGLDHKALTFRHGTRDERLTDVNEAQVVKAILDA